MKPYVIMSAILIVLFASVAAFVAHQDTPARKAILYSNDGKILKEYSGKIEYIRRNNEGIRFRLDGKRVIIQGGITVIEEQ